MFSNRYRKLLVKIRNQSISVILNFKKKMNLKWIYKTYNSLFLGKVSLKIIKFIEYIILFTGMWENVP